MTRDPANATQSDEPSKTRAAARSRAGLARLAWRVLWPWGHSPRLRAYTRLAAYGVVVTLAIAFFAARSAYADVEQQALIIGRQLSELKEFVGNDNRVLLNGQPVHVSSVTTDQPLSDVLDRFENTCLKWGVGRDEFKDLSPSTLKEAEAAATASGYDLGRFGVMRHESLDEGLVACLVRADSSGESLAGRLSAFAESGDLSQVGLLRYAYVRRVEGGKTHVVTCWTDGEFDLNALTPERGQDAPGSDPPNAVRPERSVRLLTASVEGAPHSVRIYDAAGTPDDVLGHFELEMPKLGWQVIPFVAEEVPNGLAFTLDGVDMLVFAHPGADGRTSVSMVESVSRR